MWYCSDVCFSDLNTTFDPCTEQYHTNLFGKFIFMIVFTCLCFVCLCFQTYRPMAKESIGRVFCVTGVQASDELNRNQQNTPVNKRRTSGYSDSESNTSGYLSSSSFESSGEEKRLGLNGQKVFRVWDRWGQQVQVPSGPTSSTPKQGSEGVVIGRRVNLSGDSSKSMLAIKKNLTEKSLDERVVEDSFWGIKTPCVHKSNSEGDIRKGNKSSMDGSRSRRAVAFADELENGLNKDCSQRNRNISKNQDWKRRPFLTQSTSQQDIRMTSQQTGNQRSGSDNSNYSALPRYRVKMNANTNLVTQICRSVADFADEGKPVDESMTEFLSNVDKDNLATFLNFYDKVTSTQDYERARRNPSNYEAVYY